MPSRTAMFFARPRSALLIGSLHTSAKHASGGVPHVSLTAPVALILLFVVEYTPETYFRFAEQGIRLALMRESQNSISPPPHEQTCQREAKIYSRRHPPHGRESRALRLFRQT